MKVKELIAELIKQDQEAEAECTWWESENYQNWQEERSINNVRPNGLGKVSVEVSSY